MRNAYFIFLLILSATSCQEDVENNSFQVAGIWHQDAGIIEGSNLSYRNKLEFDLDGTYEASLQVVETENVQNVIGYMSLTKGEYQIDDNTLKRFDIEQYGLDGENQYLNRDKLLLEEFITSLPEIGVKLDETGDILTLIFPCGEEDSCVPLQTYKRSK